MSRLNGLEIFVLLFVLLLLLYGLYLSHYSLEYFENVYVAEDGPLEMLTVLSLMTTFFLCCYRFKILFSCRPVRFRVMLGLLALIFLFGAGEEISWGQRIFKFETPDYFQKHNAQRELGIHNLRIGEVNLNKVLFARGLALTMILYLAVLTPLYRRNEKVRSCADSFSIPMPRNYHIIAYIVLILIVEVLVDSKRKGELTEFAGCFIFFLNVAFPYNPHIFQRQTSA